VNEPTNQSISQIVRRARDGDHEALAALLQKYRGYLTLLARLYMRRRLQARFDPSDLAQETCLEAHRNFAAFRGETEAQLVAWLKRILASKGTQLIRQFYQTQSRAVAREEQLIESVDESSAAIERLADQTGSSPSQAAQRNESSVRLSDALGLLGDAEREVIILHGLEEVPMPEVAQRLNRTHDSVWKLWARGLLKLREHLNG
jgi:RNA polymerase sigma-70 factor (ECF subfamily)